MMTSVWHRHRALAVAVWLALAVLTPRLAAQDLATTSRTAVIEQAKAEKAAASRPYEPNKVESAIDRAEDIFLSGRLHWHPFFESAYAGGGFTLGRRLPALRQRLQHHRPARQHHLLGIQADRGRVSGAAPVRPARSVVGDRRLARGDLGGLLRDWHGTHVGGRPRQLRVHAAVRLRHARLLAHATSVPAAGRPRALPMVTGVRRRLRPLGRGGLHARRRCPALAHRRPTSTCRAPPASTRASHRATRGAAGSTA